MGVVRGVETLATLFSPARLTEPPTEERPVQSPAWDCKRGLATPAEAAKADDKITLVVMPPAEAAKVHEKVSVIVVLIYVLGV